jgi:hypothetical protein
MPDDSRGTDVIRLLVPIALHVDYWNYLGWADRFANAQFTQRQRAVSARNRSSVIYTPQRVLNGRDYPPSITRDDIALRVAEINRSAPGVAFTENRRTGDVLQALALPMCKS